MSQGLSFDVQEIIKYLSDHLSEFEEDFKNNAHFVVYRFGEDYKVITGGEFEPLTVESASSFLKEVANADDISWLLKGSKGNKPKVNIALFWFSYHLNRRCSCYLDLYTLSYYVPSVVFISSLRILKEIKKVAESYNLNLMYYGELYYNEPAKEYPLPLGERIFWSKVYPHEELIKGKEVEKLIKGRKVFAWVIGPSGFPEDEDWLNKIEKAYDELTLNVMTKVFGDSASEILSLRRAKSKTSDPNKRDDYYRKLLDKVYEAMEKMEKALDYINRESLKFSNSSQVVRYEL